MSIYGKRGDTVFGDFNIYSAQAANASTKQYTLPMSEAQLRAEKLREEAERSKRKAGEPLSVPLPRTSAWAAKLPPDTQPRELMRVFARIANHLALGWHDPDATHAYFGELLASKRPNRRGFPKEVESELAALQRYYAILHPPTGGSYVWDDVRTR